MYKWLTASQYDHFQGFTISFYGIELFDMRNSELLNQYCVVKREIVCLVHNIMLAPQKVEWDCAIKIWQFTDGKSLYQTFNWIQNLHGFGVNQEGMSIHRSWVAGKLFNRFS